MLRRKLLRSSFAEGGTRRWVSSRSWPWTSWQRPSSVSEMVKPATLRPSSRCFLSQSAPSHGPLHRSSTSLVVKAWRWLPNRPRFAGTWALICTNCTVYGLYSIAPERPRRQTQPFAFSWPPRILQTEPPASSTSAWPTSLDDALVKAKRKLPTKHFWERHFSAKYAGVRDGMWYTLISSNFMHASLQHLAFNMLNLFFFGRQAEMILGLRRFLAFYLSSGIVSVAAQVFCLGYMERKSYVSCIGASGAVYAVLGYITCLMPTQVVHLYFVLPVPLWVVTGALIAWDLLYLKPAPSQTAASTYGHVAHLTGVACGVLRSGVLLRL